MKIIEIIVSSMGETRLETKGFQGTACQLASQFLEKALGAKRSEELTADFYITANSQSRLQEGQA